MTSEYVSFCTSVNPQRRYFTSVAKLTATSTMDLNVFKRIYEYKKKCYNWEILKVIGSDVSAVVTMCGTSD